MIKGRKPKKQPTLNIINGLFLNVGRQPRYSSYLFVKNNMLKTRESSGRRRTSSE